VEHSTFLSWSAQFGLSISPVQLTLLERYEQALLAWNEKTNLTAITKTNEIAAKHFLDSLAATRVVGPGPSSLLDVGSGAGFPGLPLKIYYPDLTITLLEPNQKRTAFLRYMVGILNLHAIQVVSERLEEFSPRSADRYDYVATRAFDVLPSLDLLHSILAPGGKVILFRSTRVPHDSIQQRSGFEIADEIVYELPGGFGTRVLSVLMSRRVPRGTL